MSAASTKRIRHSGTAHNVFVRLAEAQRDIFSHVEHFQLPLEHATDEWLRRVAPEAKRLSSYYQGYLEGQRALERDRIYRQHAEWRVYWRGCYYHHNGAPGSETSRPDSEILTGTWNEVDSERSMHFWKGTDRPFYAPKPSTPSPAPADGGAK